MDRSILIIAFDFPPAATSSGMQRALKLTRYLGDFGWLPTVLTAQPRAYVNTNPLQLSEIPENVAVYRAFAVDTRRIFAIRGRYPGFLAWPDPWISWWPHAVHTGRRIIRQHNPQVIWSTYPIRTTNLVAHSLVKWSGLPWIADLRDPITLNGYPPDPVRFRLSRIIEQNTISRAARVVFTADYTRRIYEERYPSLSRKSALIPNGYDESNFPTDIGFPSRSSNQLIFLHSGALQPKGRNPQCFFHALQKLKSKSVISSDRVRFIFRACGYENQYRVMTESSGVSDLVDFEDYLPYEAAIKEMARADVLMLFQGTSYNHAVPAKLYEYFFARKPILGILDKRGETQRVLNEVGIIATADIGDADDIARHLEKLIHSIPAASQYVANSSAIEKFSRRKQTQQLANLLDQVSPK